MGNSHQFYQMKTETEIAIMKDEVGKKSVTLPDPNMLSAKVVFLVQAVNLEQNPTLVSSDFSKRCR